MAFTSRILITGCLLLFSFGCNPAPDYLWTADADARYHPGDDLRWAHPDWDDTNWPRSTVLGLPDSLDIMWVRLNVPVRQVQTLGLDVKGAVAREVFWDGVLVGKGGQVGSNAAREQPGPIDTVFRIPDSLAMPGNHVVAVRLSTFKRPPGTAGLLMQFVAGDYSTLIAAPLRAAGVPLLFLGGFVLIALYYSALYIADRQRLPYLLTALLCLAVSALLAAESWRDTIGYTYDWHAVRIGMIEGLTAAVGLLLAATFAFQFKTSQRWTLLAGLVSVVGASLYLIADHEASTYAVFGISLIVAIGITGWAVRAHQSGAWLAFIGVLICFGALLVTGYDFMDKAFFPAFSVLVAGLLTSVGLQTREERQRHATARATAARLEAELLKKHLHPHFLMNTLTSLLEWVETDPAMGARAIEALAVELRALNDISGERLIPMARELALCRAHLEVMGYRRNVQFELDAAGVDMDAFMPPAVIHTLIENAVTHNTHQSGKVIFTLREKRLDGHRRLVLKIPLAEAGPASPKEGGGLRYVRARLEEAAPGQWHLQSTEIDGAWVTQIDIKSGGLI